MEKRACKEKIYPYLPVALQHFSVTQIIELALAEDLSAEGMLNLTEAKLSSKDVTSVSTLDPKVLLYGRITSKEAGTVAGIPIAVLIFNLVDENLSVTPLVDDGQRVLVSLALKDG